MYIGIYYDNTPIANPKEVTKLFLIVIADDEAWVPIDLKNNIDWESLGFYVEAYFTNPIEAQQYILLKNPDVVITDITMPMIDGLSLIENLTVNGCSSLFIVLTAHKNFEFAQRSIQLHVSDYILKPIDPEAIRNALNRIRPILENQEKPNSQPISKSSFEEILLYIDSHLSDQLSLQLISDTFFINKNYICNLFQKHLHCTFSSYLTDKRIKLAQQLLSSTQLPLQAVSREIGFNDEFYFSKVFKKNCGVSPGLYRKLHQQIDSMS